MVSTVQLPIMTESEFRRFSEKVRVDPSGCLIWSACRDKGRGYGRFMIRGSSLRAHRLSYRYYVGEIPEGLELDHLCRNTSCVNPDHLEPVSHIENLHRGNGWSGRNSRKTHCKKGHELSGDNLVPWHRDKLNGRMCKTCKYEHENERKRKIRNVSPDYIPPSQRTHCPQGHEYSENNLSPSALKKGERKCLTCAREYTRKARKAKKSSK